MAAARQAAGQPPPQLPDFDIVARCHRDLAAELDKCRNIQLSIMVVKFSMRDINNVSRLINRSLATPDAELTPLHNVATNEHIDCFPATPKDIKDMPGAALNIVLRGLGIEVDGTLEQRRQKLRVQIGLKADPV